MPRHPSSSTTTTLRWTDPWPLRPWARIATVLLAVVLTLLGAALMWVGAELIGMGGTWYFALAGAAFLIAAVLLFMARILAGASVLGLLLVGTLTPAHTWGLAMLDAAASSMTARSIPQYVVMVATGHARLEIDIGDHVVAFALDE